VLGKTKKDAENVTTLYGQRTLRLVNVLGSRGSVIDLWKNSKEKFICPESVVRYWIQAEDAVNCLLVSALEAPGVYTIPTAPEVSIGDLKNVFCEIYSVDPKSFKKIPLTATEMDKEFLNSKKEMLVEAKHPLLRKVICS
jgi:FlaA1/EpsC-like NDP-sugar epimerase